MTDGFFEEIQELPKEPTRDDILNYFMLPSYPAYEPEPYKVKGNKPLMLILKSDPTKHFNFEGQQQHSKSSLADIFYEYLEEYFEIVYETNPMASIPDIVEKKLRQKPYYILYGFTYNYMILVDTNYMKKNGIKFIFTLGDIDCFQTLELPKLIMERISCDYLLSNILNVSWEINNMRSSFSGIKNSILVEFPWGIDERYIQNKKRDIDVAFICSYKDDSGFHDRRKKIKNILDKMDGNIVTGEFYGDEYIDILNRTKIFVVEPSERGAFVQKYLEGAVCGAMLLGEIPNDSPFVDNVNIIHISDYDRLLKKKIIYYLSNDDMIKNISIRSRKDILRDYHVKDIALWFSSVMIR